MRVLGALLVSAFTLACARPSAETPRASSADAEVPQDRKLAENPPPSGESESEESKPEGGLGVTGISSTDELPRQKSQPPPKDVQETVRSHVGRFRECYEQSSEKSVEGGKLIIRLVIGTDGRVTNIGVAPESTIQDTLLQECVVQRFREMTFAPSEKLRLVTYPLQFAAAP